MEGEMMLIYTKKKYTINAKNVDLPKKFSGTSATEKGEHIVLKKCIYFTVSWMLKVTRGPGEAPSTRMSGKSSTSPILELWTQ